MRILELNIIQFGKFSDRAFTFSEGFNIVEGKNESGKSTLQAFIKFMLYGLPRRNPNVLIGERERALSWLGQTAAGSMTVESDGKKFRIERNGSVGARGAYSEKCRIIDIANGLEAYSKEVPGEVFLGIDASAYDSMCNIRQLECVSVDGDAVKGAIENLLSSGDENTSVDSALKLLDKERVRLLYKNGRGGLIYDTERASDELYAEYEKALLLEGENVKYRDELERTERQLAISKRDYDISSRKCDLFEDVKRLEKFRGLNALKKENELLSSELDRLDKENGIGENIPTYEELAEMRSASDALKKSEGLLEYAKKESELAKERLGNTSEKDADELEALLYEFGSPRNVINNINVKKRKKTGASLLSIALFALAAAFFAGAISLILWKDLVAGAITVAFAGVVAAIVGSVFASRAKQTKRAISAILCRIGNGASERDTDAILSLLEAFSKQSEERKSSVAANESAAVKLAMAEEACSAARATARKLLADRNQAFDEGAESYALVSVAERLRAYLGAREETLAKHKENDVLIRSLKAELERYSEKSIEQKITPEIEAAIKNSSFELLKRERDAALYKINELNRYKAELERRLGGLEGSRRSPNEIYPELERQKKRLEALKLRHSAIVLASERIEAASQKLKSNIVPRIKDAAQKNMSIMTKGKYTELFLDDNMALSVLADGETRPIDALSKGSCDVAYFSVRLALLETMCAEKKPPLFMDESLSQLDDERAASALGAVAEYCKGGGQSVLFTCQTRDARLADAIIHTNLISLG